MTVHHPPTYFTQPPHPISVYLIGCGGTGSQVLSCLARINYSMQALGHPGLHVTAFDHDTVDETNIGRQLFSPADLGINKATALVTRINRFFGLGWMSIPAPFNLNNGSQLKHANITITCVDSIAARIRIKDILREIEHGRDEEKPYYWMDFGNGHRFGQVILGTLTEIEQPKSKLETETWLPIVTEEYPDMANTTEVDEGPSCSIAQALGRQDLFINSTLAQLGCNLLWKLLTEVRITNRGVYLNLETMNVNPIKI